MNKFGFLFSIFLSTAALFSAGCSSGGSSTAASETLATEVNNTPCGPVQEMAGHRAIWTFYKCEEVETVKVTNETKDSLTGIVLGDLPVARGKLSLRYHNLDNEQFRMIRDDEGNGKPLMGIFLKAGGRAHDWEVNWHLVSFWMKDYGLIFTKLIIQRFDDSPCINKRASGLIFCEYFDETDFIQYENGLVYQYDCEWDTYIDKLQCLFSEVGNPKKPKVLLQTSPFGHYGVIKSLSAGQHTSLDAQNENYYGTVSDFKYTVFE